MEISTFALYGIVEAVVLLALVCVFLLVFIKRSKAKHQALRVAFDQLMVKHKALQQRLVQERETHSTSNTYKTQINDQLLATREYHQSLGAGQDISLDLNPESPPSRQAAAIRHAILVAEKEALNASTDGTPNWQFLETKFQQLIGFYVDLSRKSTSASKPSGNPSPDDSGDAASLNEQDPAQAAIDPQPAEDDSSEEAQARLQ